MTGYINVKAIIRDGNVVDVLCDDTRFPIRFEVIEVSKEFEDYEALESYVSELIADRNYKSIIYQYADFRKDSVHGI